MEGFYKYAFWLMVFGLYFASSLAAYFVACLGGKVSPLAQVARVASFPSRMIMAAACKARGKDASFYL